MFGQYFDAIANTTYILAITQRHLFEGLRETTIFAASLLNVCCCDPNEAVAAKYDRYTVW